MLLLGLSCSMDGTLNAPSSVIQMGKLHSFLDACWLLDWRPGGILLQLFFVLVCATTCLIVVLGRC